MAEPVVTVRARYEGRRVTYRDGEISRAGWVTRVRRQYLAFDDRTDYVDYVTVARDDGWLQPGIPVEVLTVVEA